MKILYIHSGRLPSRAANCVHVTKMCQALVQAGADVTLVVPDVIGKQKDIREILDYYNITSFPFKIKRISSPVSKGTLPFFLLGLLFFLIRNKDHHVYGRSVFGCLLAAFLGFKTVWESHAPAWEMGKLQTKAFKMLLGRKCFLKLVVISEELKKLYLPWLPEGKIEVLHDAAKPSEHSKFPDLAALEKPVVGYVGGLYEGKGVSIILKMAAALPDVSFLIYGGSEEQVGFWQGKTESGNVNFKGYIPQSEIHQAFDTFSIGLLPNQSVVHTHNGAKVNISSYTSPLKLFEYMAHKKLILCSDFPVLREVLDDKTGYLLPYQDPEPWIEAIREIMAMPGVALTKLKNAHERFCEHYTWEKRAGYVLTLYER